MKQWPPLGRIAEIGRDIPLVVDVVVCLELNSSSQRSLAPKLGLRVATTAER